MTIAIILAIFAAPIIALWLTTRPRPLVVRSTPVCSYLPRDIAVPTIRRRKL